MSIEPSGDIQQPEVQPQQTGDPQAAPQKPSFWKSLLGGTLMGALHGLAGARGATDVGSGLSGGVSGELGAQQQQFQNQQTEQANTRANQDQANQDETHKAQMAQMQLNLRQTQHQLHLLDPHDPEFVQKVVTEQAEQGDAGLKSGALLKTPEFKTAGEAAQYVAENHLDKGQFQIRLVPFHNAKGELVYGGLEYDNSPTSEPTKITYQGPDGKQATAVVPAGTPKSKIAEFQVAAAKQQVEAQFKEHEQKLKDQGTEIESNAQLLVSGKTAPSLIANRNGQRDKAIARAAELDPNFSAIQSESKFQSGKALDKAFTSGAEAKSITAFNTASDHLTQLDGLVDALGNGDVTALNKLGNDFAKATGSAAPTNFDAVRNAAVGEVTKVFAGAGVAQQERDEIAAPLKNSNSPAQLKGAISHLRELMASKKHELKNQYDQGKQGKPAFESAHETKSESKKAFNFGDFAQVK
jgi:hypothetical protein